MIIQVCKSCFHSALWWIKLSLYCSQPLGWREGEKAGEEGTVRVKHGTGDS
jgi:hypothetical protein